MRDELARTLVRECRKDGSRQCRGLRVPGEGALCVPVQPAGGCSGSRQWEARAAEAR